MNTYQLHFFNRKSMTLDYEIDFHRENFTKREYDLITQTCVEFFNDIDHEQMLIFLYVNDSVTPAITLDWQNWMDFSTVHGCLSLVKGYTLVPLRHIILAE